MAVPSCARCGTLAPAATARCPRCGGAILFGDVFTEPPPQQPWPQPPPPGPSGWTRAAPFLRPALDGTVALALHLTLLFVLAALAVPLASTGEVLNPLVWLKVAVTASAMSLAAPLGATADGEVGFKLGFIKIGGSLHLDATAFVLPLSFTVLALCIAGVVGRRRERRHPSAGAGWVVLASCITAVCFAGLHTLVALVTRFTGSYGGVQDSGMYASLNYVIAVQPAWLLLGAFVPVVITVLFARLSLWTRRATGLTLTRWALRKVPGGWTAAVDIACVYLLILLLLSPFAGIGLTGYNMLTASTGSASGQQQPGGQGDGPLDGLRELCKRLEGGDQPDQPSLPPGLPELPDQPGGTPVPDSAKKLCKQLEQGAPGQGGDGSAAAPGALLRVAAGVATTIGVIAATLVPTMLVHVAGFTSGATVAGESTARVTGELGSFISAEKSFGGTREWGYGLFVGPVTLPELALLLLPLGAAAVAGIRGALRHAPEQWRWARVWQPGLVLMLLWLVLALLTRFTIGSDVRGKLIIVDVSGNVALGGGLGLITVLATAFFWGTIAVLAGRLLAGATVRSLPRLGRFIGGRGTHPRWLDTDPAGRAPSSQTPSSQAPNATRPGPAPWEAGPGR